MSRGRPPAPTHLKALDGNPGKRKADPNEPKPPTRVPKCPSHLSRTARAEWRRITKHLATLNLVAHTDRAALAAYCQAWARWVEAEEQLAKHGHLVRSPNGYPMPSPYLAIANKAMEQMHRFITEFGLSPASRARVSTATLPGGKSKFEGLLGIDVGG